MGCGASSETRPPAPDRYAKEDSPQRASLPEKANDGDIGETRLVRRADFIAHARAGNGTCYELLPVELCVEGHLSELQGIIERDCVVVSWRWCFQKPLRDAQASPEDGTPEDWDPASELAERVKAVALPDELLDRLMYDFSETFLWLDWCVLGAATTFITALL